MDVGEWEKVKSRRWIRWTMDGRKGMGADGWEEK